MRSGRCISTRRAWSSHAAGSSNVTRSPGRSGGSVRMSRRRPSPSRRCGSSPTRFARDRTASELAAALPDESTVVTIGDPSVIGSGLARRGDVRVLALDIDHSATSFVRRLERYDVDYEPVDAGAAGAATRVADVVLIEVLAMDETRLVLPSGSSTIAAAGGRLGHAGVGGRRRRSSAARRRTSTQWSRSVTRWPPIGTRGRSTSKSFPARLATDVVGPHGIMPMGPPACPARVRRRRRTPPQRRHVNPSPPPPPIPTVPAPPSFALLFWRLEHAEIATQTSGEASAEVAADPVGAFEHLRRGVFDDGETEILQFVPSLSVARSLGVADVTETSRDLDDERLVDELEIDSGDVTPVDVSMDDLSRAVDRGPRCANDAEERTLERRMAAGVGEQPVDHPTPPAS